MKNPILLMVEDDLQITETFEKKFHVFLAANPKIRIANNSRDAKKVIVELMNQSTPFICFMDCDLEVDEKGIELVRQMVAARKQSKAEFSIVWMSERELPLELRSEVSMVENKMSRTLAEYCNENHKFSSDTRDEKDHIGG